MSLLNSQLLNYRDRADDDALARNRARGLLVTYLAVPGVIVSALAGVAFYFIGTCCLVWAAALSPDSFLRAGFTLVAGFVAFAIGVGLMLVADRLERASN